MGEAGSAGTAQNLIALPETGFPDGPAASLGTVQLNITFPEPDRYCETQGALASPTVEDSDGNAFAIQLATDCSAFSTCDACQPPVDPSQCITTNVYHARLPPSDHVVAWDGTRVGLAGCEFEGAAVSCYDVSYAPAGDYELVFCIRRGEPNAAAESADQCDFLDGQDCVRVPFRYPDDASVDVTVSAAAAAGAGGSEGSSGGAGGSGGAQDGASGSGGAQDGASGSGGAQDGASGSAGAPEPTNPIVGMWHEEARYDCVSGDEIPADIAPVQEVMFDDTGNFSVTWTPFEWYEDYWGTYVIDRDANTLEMTIQPQCNYIPGDTDLSGSFQIDSEASLVLRDIWFGIDREATATPACGHRLVRN